VRLRRVVPIFVAMALLLGAGSASAVRIMTSPSHAELLVGSDWVGRVILTYEEIDSSSGKSAFSISGFTFANLCSRRGSTLGATIPIRRDGRFDYRGHGFVVVGHVIGNRSYPKEIAGLASFARRGCASGPWWFGAPLPPG
jgi:hypothetical protein